VAPATATGSLSGVAVALVSTGADWQRSSADLLVRRLLPLAAALLLIGIVFQQLQRVRALQRTRSQRLPLTVRRYGPGRRLQVAAVGLGYPTLVASLVGVLFSLQVPLPPLQLPHSLPGAGRSTVNASDSTQPSPGVERLLSPDPQQSTLTASDLPGSWHVERARQVAFSSPNDAFPGWDAVYLPDRPDPKSDYQEVESLVVVYSSVAKASSAVDSWASADRAAQSQEYVPLARLGDQDTMWVEKTANRPEYVVIRVTWRYVNVVGQVAILTSSSSPHPERALQLANLQQSRIKARSAT
jgi:hypothetical protein